MCPYPLTYVGTLSHPAHLDWVALILPSQAHAGAAYEAPELGPWEGQDCIVKGGILSSRRYLPTYLLNMQLPEFFEQLCVSHLRPSV